jgi:predicted SPOUT superfamily RNA methylase MTH1
MDEIKRLQSENERLTKRLEMYERDAVYGGYYTLNRITNEHIEVLQEFDWKSALKSQEKEDKTFERATKMADGLEAKIMSLQKIKEVLKITGNDEEKDTAKKVIFRTSPEMMADVLGNSAGQQR